MTDYFALLDEQRRPWLDEEELKSKFFTLSASVHPDRTHALSESERKAAHERYTLLNAAYACLREPKERLRHLLELQTGHKPAQVQEVPGELVEVFFQIGQVCRSAEDFLNRKAATHSPLLLAELFAQGQTISERLADLRGDLLQRQARLLNELKQLDPGWQQQLPRVETIQQTLSYLHRWSAQLHERILQLAL